MRSLSILIGTICCLQLISLCASAQCAEAGTPCNDGDPETFFDMEDGNCNCAGTVFDCDDGNPCTLDYFDTALGCVNEVIDNDGDGYTTCQGDCDDNNPEIHPGSPEICNSIDDNCDGLIDSYTSTVSGCTDPVACNYTVGAACDDGSCTYGQTTLGSEIYSPSWSATDMLGSNFDLEANLNQGYTVVLDLFTYWCSPSQNMLTSGFLSDWNDHMGPNGLDVIRMVSVEVEDNPSNFVQPYLNFADWPIINSGGVAISALYAGVGLYESAVPTILIICPDGSTSIAYPSPNTLPFTGNFNYSPQMGLDLINAHCSCRGSDCTTNIGCMDAAACNYDPSALCSGSCDYGTTYFQDLDEDGYGDSSTGIQSCSVISGFVLVGGDCDDGNSNINPGATDICGDGEDSNCDGSDGCFDSDLDGIFDSDEIALGMDPFSQDSDSDFLDDLSELGDLNNPNDFDEDGVIDALDDDDDNDTILTADEINDGFSFGFDVDEDGFPNWLDEDSDDDGFSDLQEAGLDLNSDGIPDYLDNNIPNNDNDLDGYSPEQGDCDDSNPDINPGAVDICDGIDNDCDGEVDELCTDFDNDGLLLIDELSLGTNPDDPDTDDDGLNDGDEVNLYSTSALDPDSDDDGLQDGAEVNITGTDPNLADTDSDGCDDLLDYGNQCPGTVECPADINNDGSIGTADLIIVLADFGGNCD